MTKQARKYIAELFEIVGTKSVLVVMYNGNIKRLYCPFLVICQVNVPPLEVGEEYWVEAVKMTLTLEEVFIIDGRAYFVWYFQIKT